MSLGRIEAYTPYIPPLVLVYYFINNYLTLINFSNIFSIKDYNEGIGAKISKATFFEGGLPQKRGK